MATLKAEKLALKSTTTKPSSSRRYSTQQYTSTTHTTFSNRTQNNLHSWVNASFNNNNNGNGGKSSSKNPSTASTVSSSAQTSSKSKPFPKLLPPNRESSQSSSSSGNNNNSSTNKEAVHRRLVNLFADINAFFAYKASSDAAAAASTSGPGGGRGGGGDHQHQATSTSSIANCRLRPLISRADALLARLDALLDDDAVLELLEDSTALGKLREYRLRLELRANTLGQLLEKRETRVKAQEEKAVAVAVEKLTAALISCSLNLKDQVSTEEPLPKYGGLATAAHQFPTWLVAVKDLVLDSARPADDRAKFRRIFYALEDAADQRLISADADIESPDLCRVVKLLFNRHMGEDDQQKEEEVGGSE